jgi:hypothetical protein
MFSHHDARRPTPPSTSRCDPPPPGSPSRSCSYNTSSKVSRKRKRKKITEHGMQRRMMDRTAESRGGGRDAHRSRTCWRGDPWRQEEARVAGGGEEAWKETRD